MHSFHYNEEKPSIPCCALCHLHARSFLLQFNTSEHNGNEAPFLLHAPHLIILPINWSPLIFAIWDLLLLRLHFISLWPVRVQMSIRAGQASFLLLVDENKLHGWWPMFLLNTCRRRKGGGEIFCMQSFQNFAHNIPRAGKRDKKLTHIISDNPSDVT